MKAVILAAGLGTRLRPLIGEDIPKVMVSLGGKPLLLRTIELLKSQGFNEFCLNLHYLPEVITDYFGDGTNLGVPMQYSYEPELLESGGAIKKMQPWLTEDFAMVYGDVFHNLDLRPLVKLYQDQKAFGVAVVKETIHVEQSDLVEVNPETNEIIKVHSRPHDLKELRPGLFATTGIYVWSREILDFIPENQKVHLEKEILPLLVKAGKKIVVRPIDKIRGDIVVDIGKPDNYYMVQEMFSSGKLL
ncbi:MAG: NDP-sugar synthase [Parcubacteria group bacterium]|nr:NDP-sugar synthase [Parcubacteria group bacterium]